MTKVRVIVETSASTRKDLDKVLNERGISITEWFSEKILEDTNTSQSADNTTPIVDVSDPGSVLQVLRATDWAFTDENTSHTTHGIHPYPAKFIPQIPYLLISLLSKKGEVVWDPFGGSGTTALEALRLERDAISTDINPVATLVGRAKTASLSTYDEEELDKFIGRLELIISRSVNLDEALVKSKRYNLKETPNIPSLNKWFNEEVVDELVLIKRELRALKNESAQTIANAAFSKIITRVSNQDGETRYVSKPKMTPSGSTIKLYLSELKSIYKKAKQASDVFKFRKAQFMTIDLTKESPIADESVDLVVTSPPYPNATDYHLYHRFRIFWLGFNPRDMANSEIGSHLRHQRNKNGIEEYLQEMGVCLQRVLSSLRQGKYAVFVIGDSIFQGQEYQTAELVGEVAQKVGFEVIGIVRRPLHSTKRSFIGAARRLREEKLLILRKPVLDSGDIELYKPPYKLWPYEENIRLRENNALLGNSLTPAELQKNIRRLTFTHHFSIGNTNTEKEPTWQAVLENGDVVLESARKDPKYVTHGIHAYKGKFYPQLAKSLINISGVQAGSTVLDPFCGSGTVMLESYLNGYKGVGMDLSPLAAKISQAKVGILKVDPGTLEKTIDSFFKDVEGLQKKSNKLRSPSVFGENEKEALSWFPAPVTSKLDELVRLIRSVPDVAIRGFLEVCLSSIIREVSQQEPKDLRIRRRKVPLEDADVYEKFVAKVSEQCARIIKFHQHAHKAPVPLGDTNIQLQDSRSAESYEKLGLTANSVDLVVTSPPYATALPYIDTDRLSILTLFGLDSKVRNAVEESLVGAREIKSYSKRSIEQKIENEDFSYIKSSYAKSVIKKVYELNAQSDVGFRRKNMASLLYRYFDDMSQIISNLDNVLKVGGQAFLVIGNNRTTAGDEEMVIDSAKFLVEAGKRVGWKLKEVIPITVTQENRLHNKNGITENDIIWMEKVA